MMVLISYDVKTESPGGARRLRRVAKHCVDFGQRVQKSVFECVVDPAQFTELRHRIESDIDPQQDSVRYYYLGANWKRRVEHVGTQPAYDPEGPLVV